MDQLVILDSENKENYLKSHSSFMPRKVISFKEFKDTLNGSIKSRSIYDIMNNYNISYSLASIYLNNIQNISSDTPKLKELNDMYNYLNDKGDIIKNDLFEDFLNRQKITIYGRTFLTKEEKNMLDGYLYEIIKPSTYSKKVPVYHFSTLKEEVIFLASNISKLIKSGVRPSDIKIVNLNDEYRMEISKVFPWFNIPSNISIKTRLGSIHNIKKIINSDNMNEALEEVISTNDSNIYMSLLSIINKYADIDNDDIKRNIIISEVMNKEIDLDRLSDAVEEGSIHALYDENSHIFIINFNQGEIPKTYKDEDYLSDKEKELLGLNTSYEKNKYEKEFLHNFIDNHKNVTISYKDTTVSKSYYVSPFINDIDIEEMEYKDDYQDSNYYNKYVLSKMLDDYYKYNVKNNDLETLYSMYLVGYDTYNHKYKAISKEKIMKHLNNKLLLSYSSIDNYYRCSFRYYLNNVLKISKYEDTFVMNIGNIYHSILQECFNDDFNFEDAWNSKISEFCSDISIKEKFFLEKLKDELLFVIDAIKEQYSYSSFDKSYYEKKVFVHPTGEDNITFMGIIDKLLYNSKSNWVSIIDYKTGNPNINLSLLPYGMEMQLPVYLYLVKHFEELDNPKVAGFYLQKILHSEIVNDGKTSYENKKKKNLMLQGYSTDNISILEEFDSSYEDSSVIASMKVSSKGFYSYSKVLSDEAMESIVNMVDNHIKNAINDIRNSSFTINPKRVVFKDYGCEFCPFKDICYHTEEDVVNLKDQSNLEFLGGDDNE